MRDFTSTLYVETKHKQKRVLKLLALWSIGIAAVLAVTGALILQPVSNWFGMVLLVLAGFVAGVGASLVRESKRIDDVFRG